MLSKLPRFTEWLKVRILMTSFLLAIAFLGSTSVVNAADPNQGPGGPILVVTNGTTNFGRFYAEILRAEGLNSFAVADISAVNATLLASYDVVLLAKTALTSTQVTTLTNWVTAGGNLVAMDPDAQLYSLAGVASTGTSLPNAYLRIDTTNGIGNGIVGETMQFHGVASRVTLGTASALATLYSTAAVATTNPAVTLRSVGAAGGQVAFFAYDLATSIVYTRQGNPAWVGQERDGTAPLRSDDLFFGPSPSDPQANWVDLTKVAIPQADEQQRFLVKLIGSMNLDRKPLPRFWYLPRNTKAAVVMTGDDHANNGTVDRFDQLIANSPAGCSVDNWECLRGTSYIFTNTPITNAQVASYSALGFEVGLHVNTDCSNFTETSLAAIYDEQTAELLANLPSVPALRTERHHCIAWSGWAIAPKVQLARGIRLDTNYYYWPPGWVNNVPGQFTGSASPMRFADLDGSLIDVYQVVSQMTDESGQLYPYTIDTLLDRAIGPEEQYGVYTINAHTDVGVITESTTVIASALARGVPVVSAKQMLTWLDGRNGSSFGSLSFAANALNFSITPGAGATGLTSLVPRTSGSGRLVSTITRNGVDVPYEVVMVKGIEYASFPAVAGAYIANYALDTTAPTIVTRTPSAGATGVAIASSISVKFSESMDASSISSSSIELRTPTNTLVPATVSYDSFGFSASITPTSALQPQTTYTVIVKGGAADPRVKDAAGNALIANSTWAFTTLSLNCPCTIWPSSTTPTVASDSDNGSVNLGVKFRSDVNGYITGIRFYKGLTNTGTHNGYLWSAAGELLATATFANESQTGWQQVNFSSPVPVTANTVYVASYHAPSGGYAVNLNYFSGVSADNGVLHALENSAAGGNGLYVYGGAGQFPAQAFSASNYWVDVVFSPTASTTDTIPPTITIGSPTNAATYATNAASLVLSGSANDNLIVAQVTWSNDRGGSGTASGTSAWTVSGITLQTGVNVLTATASDASGNSSSDVLTVTYTPAAPDTTPPVVTVQAPASGATGVATTTSVVVTFSEAMDAATISASTIELRTAGNIVVPATVSYSGNVATLAPNAALAASSAYTVLVKGGAADPRVKDVAGNALAANSSWSFTTGGAIGATVSLWPNTATPSIITDSDTTSVELGVKFRADVAGYVTGIRFYKGPSNTGVHTGTLWTSSGQALATATFNNETASGWQQVNFSTPVAIAANTVYVASYLAPVGRYSSDSNYFAATFDSGLLHAPSSATAGGNGVYAYSPGGIFPTNTYSAANYWVDVLFATSVGPDSTPPTVVSTTPASGAVNIAINSALTVNFNEPMDPASISTASLELRAPGNVLIPSTVSYTGTTATLVPTTALANTTVYSLTVRGGTTDPRVKDAAGNALATNATFSFTTAAAGGPCSANPITAENCLTGNPASEWDISGAGDASIQGYATQISVNRGTAVSFKVDTNATNYRFDIYRMGYYGGLGARKITTVSPTATLPQNQPNCLTQASSGLIDCGNWGVSGSWTVPASATSGIYFAKVVRADTGGASHIFFIVRDDASTSDMVFQTSDTTWQAYNNYGGNSLYVGGPATNPGRAYKVSYNRPFATRGTDSGQDWVFNAEYPMVRFLESNGYNVSYISGVDTDRSGALLLNHRAFISTGHDEYWSGQQRTNVEAARAAGVSLAFFSGNEVFWKTRWENSIDTSATAYRTLVSYKETHAGAKIDPSTEWTGTWRDPRFSPPSNGGRPENALTGTLFTVNAGTSGIVVPEAEGKMRFWRYTSIAGLGTGQTATLPDGTLGYEWDSDLDNGFRPAGLIRMSNTTVSGVDKLQDYGSTYATDTANHALTFYKHASGARVFGAGTVQWSWGLDANHDRAGTPTDIRMQQATVNLFADMNVQPATLQAGLTSSSASTDVSGPAVTVTAPLANATVPINATTTIVGTAIDSGGVVGGVEVSVDGGTTWRMATGRTAWSFSWTPTTGGAATVQIRAVDDSGNLGSVTNLSVTVAGSASCPCSIWPAAQLPTSGPDLDPSSVELGTRFRANTNGFITAVRFYKNSLDTGTHTGTLWSATGTQLGTVTFSGETASGWQQAPLPSPVAITANTWYVVSYHTSAGAYTGEDNYFAASGVTNGPLYAAQDGEGGANGLYAYSSSVTFPNQTYNSENYWVDVVYTTSTGPDATAPVVTITTPTNATTLASSTTPLTIGGTASDAVGVTQVTWTNDRGGSGTATGTTAWSVSGITLLSGANVLTVTARDAAGNSSTDTLTVTYAPDTTAPAVTITTPTSQPTFVATGATVALAGSASDAVGVTQISWANDRGGSGTASGTTTWSVASVTVLTGSNVITVTARDAAGNTSTDTLTVTYAGDTTAPVVTITSPVNTATHSVANTVATLNVGGSASDAVGVTQVTWANDRGGSGTAAGTTSWTVGNIALQVGANVLTITARDAAGNLSTDVLTVTRAADTTAPVVTITSPVSATTYSTALASMTLGGTASDAVGVTQVTWVNNRGGSGTATGTTAWSVTGVALLSGSNILTVTARDAAGNQSTDTLTVTYTPDTISPVVTITSPVNATTYSTALASMTLGGTASDAVGVTQVTWSSNRGGSGTATGTTSWSAAGVALLSGSNVLTVTARDAAGNQSTDTLTVTYTPDTTAPVVTITSPANAATFSTLATTVTLGGTASDAVGVTQVTWTNSAGGSGTASGTTSWTVSSVALQLGSNVLTVTARDAAGNSSVDTITVTRTADTTAPAVTISVPTNAATFSTQAATLAFSGTASDAVGVTQVTWTNSAGGSGTATGTTSWSIASIALVVGLNNITITARDAAGNLGTRVLAVTRAADTTNPVITITGPTNQSTHTVLTGTSLALSGTASDNVGVTQVTWRKGSGAETVATGTTSWSATVPLTTGSNVFTVTARDAAGRTSTDTITVTRVF